jgi:hypothetical protein
MCIKHVVHGMVNVACCVIVFLLVDKGGSDIISLTGNYVLAGRKIALFGRYL